MNVYDSERIEQILSPLGYRPTESPDHADLIIANTCAIRAKAEQKVYSFLGRLAKLKHNNPELIIGVGGCVAQQEGTKILERVPHVDLVFGTHAIGRLPGIIQRIEARRCRLVDVEMDEGGDELDSLCDAPRSGHISDFVTIMQGCDNFCTYCVVPYVRGREYSREPVHIIEEIENLVQSGTREITLLGQNVNSYGTKEQLCSFPELLAKVNSIDDLYRIRFTTSHPKDLSDELIRAFGSLSKLCSHIHLPVQSGSDRILSRMNRKYTRDIYLEKISKLREACPDIAITSDIIVGFPGETDDDFDETMDLIQRVDYDGLFAFMYSDRPSAPASRFSEKVPESVKKERLQTLLEFQEINTRKKNEALIGSNQMVLVEGTSVKVGDDGEAPAAAEAIQWTGRTSGNKIVHFVENSGKINATEDLTGKLVAVTIEQAFSHSLRGKPIPAHANAQQVKGENCYAA